MSNDAKRPRRYRPKNSLFHRRTAFLNRFRTSEAATAVADSAFIALILLLVILLLFWLKPAFDMTRAGRLAAAGQKDEAVALINRLEAEGASPGRVQAARESLCAALIRQGRYDEALSLLKGLSGEKAADLTLQAMYGQAAALKDEKSFEAAAQAFYALKDYRDSRENYDLCRLARSVQLYAGGDERAARELLMSVEDTSLLQEAASLAAGENAAAILASAFFDPGEIQRLKENMKALSEARSSLSAGRIAVGKSHTLGVTAEGAVLAAGDNTYGQCGVSGWSQIVQVSAGAYHSAGLRLDGTVVAAGDNEYGQCDVSGWTDIAQVACTSYGTVGLKKDGTAVYCGQVSDKVLSWHGATAISAGSYAAGCLYGSGSMMSTHPGAQLNAGLYTYLAVCGPVGVAVTNDGQVVSSFDGVPDWDNTVMVSVSETAVIAVTADGQALIRVFREDAPKALPVEGRAVEAACGGTHYAVLTENGRVFAFGDNTYGQLDTQSWTLN